MPFQIWLAARRNAIGVLFGSLAAAPSWAQPAPDANRTVNLNYVYAADLGFGGYSVGGLSASVYTLPLSYTLPGGLGNGWGVRLLAPVQGGLYSFRATDTDGRRVAIDQQSISVEPGVELEIPVGTRVVLKPFAQGGIVHAFGSGVGNPDAWLYRTGARAVTQWHSGPYTYLLGGGVVLAGNKVIGPGFEEHYLALQVGAEMRRALGFKVGDWTPDLGLYTGTYYYPEPLVFSRFLRSTLRVTNQGEVGVSTGSATPFHVMGLANPRIGVGYVFGGGLNVYHVTFGFPF